MSEPTHPLYGRPVEIRSSWWKQGIRLLAGVAFLAAAYGVFQRTEDGERVMPILASGFLGIPGAILSAYAARELVRPGPRLRISPEGLEDRSLGLILPWGEILHVDEVDNPGNPRWLLVALRNEGVWFRRLPPLKRLGWRIRRHGWFGPFLIVPLGGLAMPADEVRDLIFAYRPSPARGRRGPSPAGGEPEIPTGGLRLWWLKWKFAAGRSYKFGVISAMVVVLTVLGIYEAFDPPRVVEIVGELESVELLDVPGHLRITVSTPDGRVVATSRRDDYRPESFPPAPYRPWVQARAFEEEPTLGLFHLTVDGRVWIDNDPLPGDAWWFGLAVSGVSILGVVIYVEHLWRWRMRQSPERIRRRRS